MLCNIELSMLNLKMHMIDHNTKFNRPSTINIVSVVAKILASAHMLLHYDPRNLRR